MASTPKLPIGIEYFEKIRTQGFYYIDKTMFIKELLDNWGIVNLFTRPRRFGKTLNMSMLKAFFEIEEDTGLFDGLSISHEVELCEAYQGKYPVVFLSMKSVEGDNFKDALDWIRIQISKEINRILEKMNGISGSKKNNDMLDKYIKRTASDIELAASLGDIMHFLRVHYGRQVILLIDEYDVPLDKANEKGYYDQMVTFLRGFFGEAFKTNQDLLFAVVTGCLRISKESIFTGINNLKVDTISDKRYDEYFGFTDENVKTILADFGLTYAYEDIKSWYDGYRFGTKDVYCPWDVINHCDKLLENPKARPRLYWNNTSSNQIVRRFVDKADATTRGEIERLISGECVLKKLIETLTYEELDEDIEHLWSVLYLTGYLTTTRTTEISFDSWVELVIPNREIREIYVEKIQKWFEDKLIENQSSMEPFYQALCNGDAKQTEQILNGHLRSSISYYDAYESFYHGFLLGLLKGRRDWAIKSNREAGVGRGDIQICSENGQLGIIIELKYGSTRKELDALCEKAIRQAVEKQYADPLIEDGYENIYIYGIAFHKKSCCVQVDKVKTNSSDL